ncbi:MAG: UvrD-helicase domain-containing protein [Deltaproteobacteria bacterium]|nr:UvrD-helicase domain-containing protein [Deltaproteobacteria bacterium]
MNFYTTPSSATSSSPQNDVVTAGAGTGKTYALVNDYVFALLGLDGTFLPRSPQRILAITFTDKAAAEMRSRVIDKVSRLVRSPKADADINERLEKLNTKLPPPATLKAQAKQLASAPISTFHALCTSLLRDLALKAKVDPAFTVLDDTEERLLLEETAEAVVLDVLATADAPFQKEVAELSARLSLRRIGRGRGLVDELVDRSRALAERGMLAHSVRPVVDRAKAALTLEEPVQQARDDLKALVKALEDAGNEGTLLLSTQLARCGNDFLDAIYRDSPDKEAACAAHFERTFNLMGQRTARAAKVILSDAQRSFSTVGVALVDATLASHAEAFCSLLVRLEARVHQEKQARGVLGFGDLLLKTRDLLREDPQVRQRVKRRFDRILVDEYQDTSPVQEDIVAFLAEYVDRAAPVPVGVPAMGALALEPGRLFVVGDPKQSIYGFRGADARLFAHTRDVVINGTETCEKSGRPRSLRNSYRSRAPVCEAINLVADVLFGKSKDESVPFSAEDALVAVREGSGKAGAMWRCHGGDGFPAELAEAFVIARKLRSFLLPDEGEKPLLVFDKQKEEQRRARPKDVAILVRRIRTAGPIARALAHQGVPARITGGEGFFSREEVVDVIAVLRLVVEPGDDLAALTVMRAPFIGVVDDDLLRIVQDTPGWYKGFSLQDAFEFARKETLVDGSSLRLLQLEEVLIRLRSMVGEQSAAKLLDVILDELTVAECVGVEGDALERMANLDKLRGMLDESEGLAVSVIQRMWNYLDAPPKEGVASALSADVDAVQIMTIHQAKGLEFPVVVLAELGGALPKFYPVMPFHADLGIAVSHRGRPIEECIRRDSIGRTKSKVAHAQIQDLDKSEQEAELCRLLYVAMTRARDWLFLIGEERNTGDASFRRLIERTRTTFRRAFDDVMPMEKVAAFPGPRRELQATRVPLPDAPLAPPVRGIPRVVPSALSFRTQVAFAKETDLARARVLPHMARARARGRAAHHILARVGEGADFSVFNDDENALFAIRSIARSCGLSAFDDENEELFLKLVKTIQGPLAKLVHVGAGLSFEELVSFEHARGAVVQGSADLVARTPEWTLVVDFKSSARGASSEDTHLQLCAYAAGLEADGCENVRMAAWPFGEKEVSARTFVDEDRRRLDEAIGLALLEQERSAVDAHARSGTSPLVR